MFKVQKHTFNILDVRNHLKIVKINHLHVAHSAIFHHEFALFAVAVNTKRDTVATITNNVGTYFVSNHFSILVDGAHETGLCRGAINGFIADGRRQIASLVWFAVQKLATVSPRPLQFMQIVILGITSFCYRTTRRRNVVVLITSNVRKKNRWCFFIYIGNNNSKEVTNGKLFPLDS